MRHKTGLGERAVKRSVVKGKVLVIRWSSAKKGVVHPKKPFWWGQGLKGHSISCVTFINRSSGRISSLFSEGLGTRYAADVAAY